MSAILTVDSNLACVTKRVAELLYPTETSRWCDSTCSCKSIDKQSMSSDVIYYDTPIAMCESIDDMPDANSMFNVLYINTDVKNYSYARIMKNLKALPRAVVITSAASSPVAKTDEPVGLYNYSLRDADRCEDDMIVRFLVLLINAYMKYKRFVHPDDILADLNGEKLENSPTENSCATCTAYDFSRDRLSSKGLRRDIKLYH